MPELPEVETVCRGLRKHVLGKCITHVEVFYEPVIRQENLNSDTFSRLLENQMIHSIERRGKYIVFVVDQGWIVCHLRMTGKLLVRPGATNLNKHDLLVFTLSDGDWLVYEDIRRFGGFFFTKEDPYRQLPLQKLGPEPLEDAFNSDDFWKTCRKRQRPIKSHLLDQSVVAGIGNIYADEILFRAGIRPRKSTARLTKKEAAAIVNATKEILEEAVAAGGSTIRDYVDSENRQGSFQLSHRVYGRAQEPCYCCGTPLKSVVVGGRRSVYCPKCQKS